MESYEVKEKIRATFKQLMQLEQVKTGLEILEADQARCIAEQKVMVTVEAPTFAEGNRAQFYAER